MGVTTKLDSGTVDALRVAPGETDVLGRRDSAFVSGNGALGKRLRNGLADEELQGFTTELARAQELLYASGSASLLVILQGMDAAGKDGTIKHVMSGVNPQGCTVTSFKQPSVEELGHDFLWRAAKVLPERGRIGIFNRSYYEDVVVVRVHPELLDDRYGHGGTAPPPTLWRQRFEDIVAFERHLHRNGTRIVKLFLHISNGVQRKRILDRLGDPAKYWKFSSSDLAERRYWDQYKAAYDDALAATSTTWAPWYVIPADHKHVLRALVAGILVREIDELGLTLPVPSPSRLAEIEAAKARLLEQ